MSKIIGFAHCENTMIQFLDGGGGGGGGGGALHQSSFVQTEMIYGPVNWERGDDEWWLSCLFDSGVCIDLHICCGERLAKL